MDSTTSVKQSNNSIPGSDLNIVPSVNYLKGSEAREALIRGVNAVNAAIAPTIGAKGRDALLGAFEWPYSISTNDGASIAEKVKCADPYENMGANILKESIGRANKESGDGSTTTCILTAAILKEGMKYAETTTDFKAELNACLPMVLESIDKLTQEVKPEDVWKVAATSAQDKEMGKLIGEIYQKIGKEGVISWEPAPHDGTTYEIKDGVELRGVGFIHPTFINANGQGPVNDPRKGDRIIVNDAHILISAEKISNSSQLEPYVSGLLRNGIKEMVLFCDDIDPIALAEIELTGLGIDKFGQPAKQFRVIVLRAPTLWKDWIYEDFAYMTGATIFGAGLQAQFKGGASLSWLGFAEKLIIKRGSTDVIGTKDLTDYIATLKEAAFDHQEYEKRVEWLNSKAAVVKMGARSEVELTYKRLKFEDAKNAAKMALKGGVVLGGGYVLTKAAEAIDNPILRVALQAPTTQIIQNGCDIDWEELEKQGIYDAADVPKNAIKAAISVAGTVLNCSTIVPLEHEQKYR